MKLGIIMPVILGTEESLLYTRQAISHLRSSHEQELFLISNKLHIRLPHILNLEMRTAFQGKFHLVHEPGVERSVIKSWNHGAMLAKKAGCDLLMFVENDTVLRTDCIDKLVEHLSLGCCALCSGINYNDTESIAPDGVTTPPDFACFVMRLDAYERHRRFDENFARVWARRETSHCVHAAQFYHHGSITSATAPRLHIVMPCARYWNLAKIVDGYLHDMEPHPFEIRWHILVQGPEPDPKGNNKVNEALDDIRSGWVCIPSDDTVQHPRLFRRLAQIIRENPDAGAVVFTEDRNNMMTSLCARPDQMVAYHVCGGQVFWDRAFLGNKRLDPKYLDVTDGYLIQEMYQAHKQRFVFVDEPLTRFGSLEWGLDPRLPGFKG